MAAEHAMPHTPQKPNDAPDRDDRERPDEAPETPPTEPPPVPVTDPPPPEEPPYIVTQGRDDNASFTCVV